MHNHDTLPQGYARFVMVTCDSVTFNENEKLHPFL